MNILKNYYNQFVATGKIPLDFSLTSEQIADSQLQNAVKKVTSEEVKNEERNRGLFQR